MISSASTRILHTQGKPGSYSRAPVFPPAFLDGVVSITSNAIGSVTVPSSSGYAIAYRWRSLPRVHQHRASSP